MASYPYARVAHLIGADLAPWQQPGSWAKTPRTATPTTLTGNAQSLYSYGLCILFKDERGYWLHVRNSSLTTNRHIDAVQSVLGANGYVATDEQTELKRGWDRFEDYRLFVKREEG
jgi:hypothetical protein